jgi:tetratricopeptide (TPR) repeat protein
MTLGQYKLEPVMRFAVPLFSIIILPALAVALQTGSNIQIRKSVMSAEQTLTRGIFYYNNNDVSDAAAKQFQEVIKKYPKTTEAEEARYYLGNYYRRKYYITREKWRRTWPESLVKAQQEYRAYVGAYSIQGSRKWLSDARFNLSLIDMELGDYRAAEDQLSRIILYESVKDPAIYIDQLVWSTNAEDVIDFEFSAKELAEFARGQAMFHTLGSEFESVLPSLKKWCQSYKSRKSAAQQ